MAKERKRRGGVEFDKGTTQFNKGNTPFDSGDTKFDKEPQTRFAAEKGGSQKHPAKPPQPLEMRFIER